MELNTNRKALAFAKTIERLVEKNLIIIDSWVIEYSASDNDKRLRNSYPNIDTEHAGFRFDIFGKSTFLDTFQEELDKLVYER